MLSPPPLLPPPYGRGGGGSGGVGLRRGGAAAAAAAAAEAVGGLPPLPRSRALRALEEIVGEDDEDRSIVTRDTGALAGRWELCSFSL